MYGCLVELWPLKRRRFLRKVTTQRQMVTSQLFNSSEKYLEKRASEVDIKFYGWEKELQRYKNVYPPSECVHALQASLDKNMQGPRARRLA